MDWIFAVAAGERRFVSVKVTGAVVLWTGMEPKLGFVGVSWRPESAVADAASWTTSGLPPVTVESDNVAFWVPGVCERN